MSRLLPIGLKGLAKLVVTPQNTADKASGAMTVFSTPMMIGLGEKAAFDSVEPLIRENGETTVGTNVTMDHLAATPLGMTVTAESVLKKQDNRSLLFDIIVRDEAEVIGKGTHTRAIVKIDKFMKRVEEKGKSKNK